MFLFEMLGISATLCYIVALAGNHSDRGHFLLWSVFVATAGWVTEETCIRLYTFYGYSQGWRACLSHLPLLVILAWPVIIRFAGNLASQLLGSGHRLVPLVAGGIVLTDAVLIEIAAVRSGFWTWQAPGIFDVPLIGILGWAWFAFLCAFLYEEGRRRNHRLSFSVLILILPPLGTHLFLLISWWGLFRWINIPIKPGTAVAAAWMVSLGLVITFLRFRSGRQVEKKTLLLRLPAAFFFFALLLTKADGSVPLIFFGAAFLPPYLALMAQQFLVRRKPQEG